MKVKPLEWVSLWSDGMDIEAKTPFGEYVIIDDGKFSNLWLPGHAEDDGIEFFNIDAAKEHANKHWNDAILSSIEELYNE